MLQNVELFLYHKLLPACTNVYILFFGGSASLSKSSHRGNLIVVVLCTGYWSSIRARP